MEVEANEWMAHSDFLAHYGVPGMKWGVRKSRVKLSTKSAYKKAKKDYSKAFDTAYGHSSRHIISQYFGKNKKISDKNWNKATKAAEKLNKAEKAYKMEKKDALGKAKEAKKQAYKEYEKAQSKMNRRAYTHIIRNMVSSKSKAEQKKLDDDYINKLKASTKAENEYKRIKKKYR